jgi:hypothetical protein
LFLFSRVFVAGFEEEERFVWIWGFVLRVRKKKMRIFFRERGMGDGTLKSIAE